MTQKPREHLELPRTCRNDVGTSIDPSATASPYFSWNSKNSTSLCCNLEMKPMWTPNYQVCIYILLYPNLYILGQNTALLIPATKHDSYQLEIFTLVWWGLRLLFWWSNSQRRYRIAVCQWKFSENQKKSSKENFPEYPEIYLISKPIRPNKYPFNSHVGPRWNIWHKNQGNISSFLVPVEMT